MIGFIGAGNMAGAIIAGMIKKNVLSAKDIAIFDTDSAKMEQVAARFSVQPTTSAEALISLSDVVVLAVKPNVVSRVLSDHRENLASKAVVSIAAGWTSSRLSAALDPSVRYLRVMPNTPALVGEGMTAFSRQCTLAEAEKALMERVFGALGRLEWVEEYQMEAVTGTSGSGPAYAYMFIEAMADGGVACGLPRDKAIVMAAQTLLGSAKMALESGLHPGALKDMVCSPGGTTIEAVRTLEEASFRAAVMNAVTASAKKAEALIHDEKKS